MDSYFFTEVVHLLNGLDPHKVGPFLLVFAALQIHRLYIKSSNQTPKLFQKKLQPLVLVLCYIYREIFYSHLLHYLGTVCAAIYLSSESKY